MPDSCDAYDDKDITDRLLAIHTLHATSFIPILLSLELRKGNFTDKDKAKILRAIEVYIFRNATIAGKTANSTEVFFSKIAHDIYEEKLIKANKIIEEIKKEMIPDKDFYNSFCTFSKKRNPILDTSYFLFIVFLIRIMKSIVTLSRLILNISCLNISQKKHGRILIQLYMINIFGG